MFNFWNRAEKSKDSSRSGEAASWEDLIYTQPREAAQISNLADHIKSSSQIVENPYFYNQDGLPISKEERLIEFLKREPIQISTLKKSDGSPEIFIYNGYTRMAYAMQLGIGPSKITVEFGNEITTLDVLIKRSRAS